VRADYFVVGPTRFGSHWRTTLAAVFKRRGEPRTSVTLGWIDTLRGSNEEKDERQAENRRVAGYWRRRVIARGLPMFGAATVSTCGTSAQPWGVGVRREVVGRHTTFIALGSRQDTAVLANLAEEIVRWEDA